MFLWSNKQPNFHWNELHHDLNDSTRKHDRFIIINYFQPSNPEVIFSKVTWKTEDYQQRTKFLESFQLGIK